MQRWRGGFLAGCVPGVVDAVSSNSRETRTAVASECAQAAFRPCLAAGGRVVRRGAAYSAATITKGETMSSDAIVTLKADHKEIRRLFREFGAAGDKAEKKKAKLVGQIIELLTVHTYIENEVMYPEVRTLLPDLEDDVLESYEEHHVADVLCMELAGMAPDAERFDAKATVLIENVTHHIKEEEDEWFPQVRAGLSRKQLQEIGARLEEARAKAPRSPAQPSAMKKTIDAVIS
jgi:hemerythrin-like domain-containing protein